MNKIQAALAACSFALAGAADAGTFSNFIVFGDSLSDAGTYIPIVPPGGGRFTTNPGPVWAENVSGALGFASAPAQYFNGASFVANPGGTDWAQGGARVNAVPGYGMAMAEPVSTQLGAYLSGNAVNRNALYAFWAGANDIFVQATSGASSAVIQANVTTAAQDLAAQAARLQAAGARYIVVLNLPDIGQTPAGVGGGPAQSAALSGLSQLYNYTLNSALSSAHVQALQLDVYSLFNEILADPAAYGFAVANTGVACTTASSLTCTSATLATPTAASSYMFADGVHPTTAAHQIISDYALSALRAPAIVARTADRMVGTADAQWLGSDNRQRRFLDGLQAEGGADVYVSGQAVDAKIGSQNDQPRLSGNPYGLRVGVNRNFGDGWFGGLSFSYVADNFDVAGIGSGDGQGIAVTGYGSKRIGNLYVSAAASLLGINYDIKRNFNLGIASRTETGNASGNVKALRVETGYDLGQGLLRHGPLAALTERHVYLAGYSEMSGRSTAMAYGDQEFDQLRASAGYQASWQAMDALRLSGRLTWENETKDSKRNLSFGLASNDGRMSLPVGNSNSGYGQLDIGADWALSRASALSATLDATSSQHGSHQEALLVSYSRHF